MTAPANILVIMADEMRRDAIGALGPDFLKTPNLDALAARGTVFSNAYTPSPICVPARAAIACGRPVHRIGTWDSATPWAGTPRSWMHDLRDAGIDVTSIGKLHFRAGCDSGFSREILPMHVHGEGWTVGLLRENLPDYPATRLLAEDVGYGDTDYNRFDRQVTAAACAHIAAKKAERWAAFVSYVSPHYPLRAPDAYAGLYDPDALPAPVPETAADDHPELRRMRCFFDYDDHFDSRRASEARAAYYALCSFIDDQVGQLMRTLEEAGQQDETLVLFMSDHGDMLGDHGIWTKQVMYEASAGVPLIAAGPGFAAGAECAHPVSLTSLYATVLRAAGIDAEAPDPASPALQEIAAMPEGTDRTAFSEYHDGGSTRGMFMVRWDRWKVVHFVGERPQLFDLATDPQERDDLALAGHNDILAEGVRRLRAICDPDAVNARAFADQKARIAELGGEAACRALGDFDFTPVKEAVG